MKLVRYYSTLQQYFAMVFDQLDGAFAKVCFGHLGAIFVLNFGHELSACRLDPGKDWLQNGHGSGCTETKGEHHPSVCPKGRRFERANATREESNDGIVTINLSEMGVIKDQAGKSHQALILWDTAADSCWVSSKLAKSFPSAISLW